MSSTAATPLFHAQGLTKTYDMGEIQVQALRGVDVSIYPKEFIVLLGASGSGKSTLLNILGGLDTATHGTLTYQEMHLETADEAALTHFRREHVGFVFQFYNLIASLTALENVSIVTDISSEPLDPAYALELVGLKERVNHFPSQLSGGEQQRVAIARAIAKTPNVLFCDEPTGALDFFTGAIVLEALKSINEQLGTTTVLITHNESIAKMADRVIKLADGQIASIEENPTKLSPKDLKW